MSRRKHVPPRRRLRRRDESGVALVMSVVVSMVALTLVTALLAAGLHLNTATTRERKWQLALQVAEAGVERAVAELNVDLTYPGEATPVAIPGGEYSTEVTMYNDGFQVDAVGYVPSSTAGNRIQRRIQVVYGPEPQFKYALFSYTSMFLKSTGGIDGDVFANEDVELWNGTEVVGNVVSSQGKLKLNQNAKVLRETADNGGNAYSGGVDTSGSPDWAIKLDNNAVIEGDAHAQVETVCDGANNYNIVNGGDILGRALTPGNVFGTDPAGGVEDACELRYPKSELPTFNWQPWMYPGLVEMSVSAFNALPANSLLSGNLWVQGSSGDVIDMACKTITGDFFLYTEARIKKANVCGGTPFYSGSPDATLFLVTSNNSVSTSAPSVDVENTLELPAAPDPSPALMIFSQGLCDLKNSVISSGAVYCKTIDIKNGIDIRYDPRIERILGFGGALYVRASFRELTSTTPL